MWRKILKKEYIYVILVGLLYLTWALHLKQSWAPDESMRDDIALYIFNHGSLPRGDEAEILNSTWGTSYGFTPYLPSLIAVLFMKVVSLVRYSTTALLVAQRLVSVCAGMGTALFSIKAGKRLFHSETAVYLFASFICLLPQFVFLCTYVNNDCFALFSCVVIFYFWIAGIQDGWNWKNSIGLAVGIAMCALSYYNAYGFILASIVVYFASNYHAKGTWKNKNIWKFALVIFLVAFALAGWFFIRNAIIYDGDFLGMRSSSITSELYARNEYKPSNRSTARNSGEDVFHILEDGNWLPSMVLSFIGNFGYMSTPISEVQEYIYIGILGIGGFWGIRYGLKNKKKRGISLVLIFTMIMPWLLIFYSTYTTDYQAQGRYVISMLPGLAYFAVSGYETTFSGESGIKKNLALQTIFAVWIFMLLAVFVTVIFPNIWTTNIYTLAM